MRTGEVLDAAAEADRSALFAALQAACLVIIDLAGDAGRIGQLEEFYAPIRRALRVGAPLGSPADLAARDAGDHTEHARVSAALRLPAPGTVLR